MSLQEFQIKVLPVKDRIFRFALRLLGSAPEAEDLVQEVLIRLWNTRNKLEEVDNIEAWSMRITRNMAVDRLRQKKRHLEPIDEALPVAAQTADPAQQVETEDTLDLVRKCMESLPDTARQAMALRDIDGWSYQEIAETLDLNLNQVKVILHRARVAVRNQLLKTDLLKS